MLVAYKNKAWGNDKGLLIRAAQADENSLFIDAANCADPYDLFGIVDEWQLKKVYVMNAEALYRFRDTLLAAKKWMQELQCQTLYVSSIGGLFTYNNEHENQELIRHCYYILSDLSQDYTVIASIDATYEKQLCDVAHKTLEDKNGTYR